MHKIGIECESIEEDETWGVGRIVKKLLEEISRRPELQKEFKFFLYFKSKTPNLPYLNNPIFIKKIIGVPSFSLYYYLFLPAKLWSEKLDLMFFPNYMLPIIFRGKSLVMLTEDIYHEVHSGTLPLRYKLAYQIFAGWAAKRATRIMAISESSKEGVSQLFNIDPARIVVNQLGVDLPCHSRIENRESKIGNYILYVGQTFPRRHLRETISAFEIIASQFPALKLIAIGKDKYNPPIIEKLKNKTNRRLGRDAIIYKDYVSEEELAQLYAGAGTVVYVSSKEAFGLPPLEALGYGVPAVVADQPVTREIFGDKAFFVGNPNDPDSIAEAIKKALTDEAKRREIIADANRILQKYTWQRFADRFLNLIRI